MSIDVSSLTNTMIDGARRSIGERWPAIRAVAEPELRKLAQTLVDVQQLVASGAVGVNRALQLVEMQRNTAMSVLRTIEGLSVLAARDALNAAVQAVGPAVNRLVGFTLIGDSTGKPAPRPVKAHFKAGKDV